VKSELVNGEGPEFGIGGDEGRRLFGVLIPSVVAQLGEECQF